MRGLLGGIGSRAWLHMTERATAPVIPAGCPDSGEGQAGSGFVRGKGEAEALRLLAQVKEAADSLDLTQLGRRAEALESAAASVAPV
jgi:hypothetical protein